MSINKITIKNCKSIEFMELNLKKNVNCFIGINNVGKTNIMKILYFFHLNLTREVFDDSMFNKTNPYNDEIEISVEYDFSELINKVQTITDPFEGFFSEFFSKMKFNDFGSNIDPTNEIVDKIMNYVEEYTTNNKCTLTLKYNRRNKSIYWNVKEYDFRAFVSVRFPIFFLESRNINLYNWELIWKVIGEIAPFRKKVSISKSIKGVFELDEEIEGNYENVIYGIIEEFEKSNIKIRQDSVYEKISQIIQLQLGGKDFDYESHQLKLGSYGMNSYSFMSLYVKLILRLFENKHLSSPLIMIDEPELHIHLKKIEEFVREIKQYDRYVTTKWIFSTHSPSFTKNIIIENEEYEIFHVTNTELFNKSHITRINGFKQKKYKLLSDNEANLFFSEICLFVEGETELEIFRNGYLRTLFPKLHRVDIYSFDGKEDKLKLVNPNDRKSKIKYLVLIDMDKILNYSSKSKKYKTSGNAYLNVMKNNNIVNREKYHYKKKFKDTFRIRNEIAEKLKFTTFEIDSTGLCIKQNQERYELIELMQQYYAQYNFMPFETTIEGAIINRANYHLFYEWVKGYNWEDSKFETLYTSLQTDSQKTSLLRVIFFGKTEWLNGKKEDKNASSNSEFVKIFKIIKEIRNELEKSNLDFGDKTSGWITLYLNWFFNNKLDLVKTENIFINRSLFHASFPELGKVIDRLEGMV
ncbi:retron Eco8 family effector endonuclease [Paenibacillus sp. MMS20-IR301]|uniref:retron Eco8 family effector endonuclease n=1 Tax=Paenibacillus sp. MMS20-IR301 TaxID=2895946 RepID=UPI0028E82E9A|nr:retron Eco8 family effector endonuclease [Paenibacillus sp. MMS20-IR301]WNS43890.1 retron Eco8 family effector endonuclease [Paenibacillus sp. MMS20-IR301]